jgi:hypothetical protein
LENEFVKLVQWVNEGELINEAKKEIKDVE